MSGWLILIQSVSVSASASVSVLACAGRLTNLFLRTAPHQIPNNRKAQTRHLTTSPETLAWEHTYTHIRSPHPPEKKINTKPQPTRHNYPLHTLTACTSNRFNRLSGLAAAPPPPPLPTITCRCALRTASCAKKLLVDGDGVLLCCATSGSSHILVCVCAPADGDTDPCARATKGDIGLFVRAYVPTGEVDSTRGGDPRRGSGRNVLTVAVFLWWLLGLGGSCKSVCVCVCVCVCVTCDGCSDSGGRASPPTCARRR